MQIPVCGTFLAKIRNCPGTLGDVNPLRNKGLRFPPRRKLASKRVQNTTLGAIAQKNTSIYQWVGVPGQLQLISLEALPADPANPNRPMVQEAVSVLSQASAADALRAVLGHQAAVRSPT